MATLQRVPVESVSMPHEYYERQQKQEQGQGVSAPGMGTMGGETGAVPNLGGLGGLGGIMSSLLKGKGESAPAVPQPLLLTVMHSVALLILVISSLWVRDRPTSLLEMLPLPSGVDTVVLWILNVVEKLPLMHRGSLSEILLDLEVLRAVVGQFVAPGGMGALRSQLNSYKTRLAVLLVGICVGVALSVVG
ncbi:hypothetical protein KIPB_007765 [Kipferlia bialata]|uniref:Uncharacterized protein n=1 Tax=Kipferlia bialata TaxID=797122 RepID=A0A9K3CRK5_9EUKA|nr:hypothetical protein KIPB_001851 [Kipferlia bialata]GIQ80970.1 hypothetical protein KIPB_001856 [Kipferlia bialata]GIQ80980.1 hypothetical protein KIPB_001869 [Kipferlia bialata]GIQ85997.1 hypothetical protein KIPB_007765 [Kipferlia bialata]|eukprot:g1851.t1